MSPMATGVEWCNLGWGSGLEEVWGAGFRVWDLNIGVWGQPSPSRGNVHMCLDVNPNLFSWHLAGL